MRDPEGIGQSLKLDNAVIAEVVDVSIGQSSNEAMEPVAGLQIDHVAHVIISNWFESIHLDAPQFGLEGETEVAVAQTVTIDAGLALTLDDRAFLEAVGAFTVLTTVVCVEGGSLGKALSTERAREGFEQNANLEWAPAVAAFAFLLVAPDGDDFVCLEDCAGHLLAPFR